MEPSDRAERLSELSFVNALIELLRASGRYTDVDPQALRSSRREARVIPDISCYRDGRQVVIECKGVAPAVEGRIARYLDQLARLREAYPVATVVIAFPERLQETYSRRFRAAGYEVWDTDFISREFGDFVGAVSDARLHNLFYPPLGTRPEQTSADQLTTRLQSITCGSQEWSKYQKWCVDALEFLFVPPLEKPLYELVDEPRLNRRDIILPNYAESGFWRYIREKFAADYIVVDAKNYCTAIRKAEVLQVANYLKPVGAGMFGMICTRHAPPKRVHLIRREQWTLYGKMILFLADEDLTQMLTYKATGTDPEQVLRQKIEEFRLAL
jgi:hypothetical protein